MTYLTNIINAVKRKPYVEVVTKTEYKWKDNVVYLKDPHGLIKRDLATIERFIKSKPYKVGDTLESVAYRQGQLDLYNLIRTKMVETKTRQLP